MQINAASNPCLHGLITNSKMMMMKKWWWNAVDRRIVVENKTELFFLVGNWYDYYWKIFILLCWKVNQNKWKLTDDKFSVTDCSIKKLFPFPRWYYVYCCPLPFKSKLVLSKQDFVNVQTLFVNYDYINLIPAVFLLMWITICDSIIFNILFFYGTCFNWNMVII